MFGKHKRNSAIVSQTVLSDPEKSAKEEEIHN
jgi:hypothetical protein